MLVIDNIWVAGMNLRPGSTVLDAAVAIALNPRTAVRIENFIMRFEKVLG